MIKGEKIDEDELEAIRTFVIRKVYELPIIPYKVNQMVDAVFAQLENEYIRFGGVDKETTKKIIDDKNGEIKRELIKIQSERIITEYEDQINQWFKEMKSKIQLGEEIRDSDIDRFEIADNKRSINIDYMCNSLKEMLNSVQSNERRFMSINGVTDDRIIRINEITTDFINRFMNGKSDFINEIYAETEQKLTDMARNELIERMEIKTHEADALEELELYIRAITENLNRLEQRVNSVTSTVSQIARDSEEKSIEKTNADNFIENSPQIVMLICKMRKDLEELRRMFYIATNKKYLEGKSPEEIFRKSIDAKDEFSYEKQRSFANKARNNDNPQSRDDDNVLKLIE